MYASLKYPTKKGIKPSDKIDFLMADFLFGQDSLFNFYLNTLVSSGTGITASYVLLQHTGFWVLSFRMSIFVYLNIIDPQFVQSSII